MRPLRSAGAREGGGHPIAVPCKRPPVIFSPSRPLLSPMPLQLEWRLSGNRAPLGLFFHAGGLAAAAASSPPCAAGPIGLTRVRACMHLLPAACCSLDSGSIGPACSAAGLQSQPERIAQLRKFIEHAAAKRDVYFVTNQQVGPGAGWLPNTVTVHHSAPAASG